MQDYRDVVATGVPTYQQVLARVNYREYAYGRLLLPLATDRRRVDQLLVFIHERPAKTLSERVIVGSWVTSRDATQQPQPSLLGDRAHGFKVIFGGKTD
jgi:hypothetical protein